MVCVPGPIDAGVRVEFDGHMASSGASHELTISPDAMAWLATSQVAVGINELAGDSAFDVVSPG